MYLYDDDGDDDDDDNDDDDDGMIEMAFDRISTTDSLANVVSMATDECIVVIVIVG